MYPIAFHIGSFAVHWYGIFIGIGFLVSFLLLLKIRKYADLTTDQVYNISMIALFAGVIGARVFYVIQFWDQFRGRGLLAILNVHEGGLVFYGGFILAFTAECVYAKWPTVRRMLGLKEKQTADGAEPRKNISLLALLDVLGPAMALAHAFGRVSCFMQGCCFGKPAPNGFPLAVQFPKGSFAAVRYPSLLTDGSAPVYPVQLFESAGNVLMCIVLLLLLRKRKYAGMVGGVYLILYGVMRFLIEFMRGDHTDSILGLTPSQFIAVAIAIPGGVIVCLAARKLGKKKERDAEKETEEESADA
jgi:phosphatidylglycerol:prolipoprotein diacylglycerol transferase